MCRLMWSLAWFVGGFRRTLSNLASRYLNLSVVLDVVCWRFSSYFVQFVLLYRIGIGIGLALVSRYLNLSVVIDVVCWRFSSYFV